MDEVISLVHSVSSWQSHTLGETEDQFNYMREVLEQKSNRVNYGLIVTSIHTVMADFFELVATHKYCAQKDRTPEKRSLNNIMTTMALLTDKTRTPDKIRYLKLTTQPCGPKCVMSTWKNRECVDRNGYYAEMGFGTKNLAFDMEPLTKYQLASIRTYKMSGGNSPDRFLKRSFSK